MDADQPQEPKLKKEFIAHGVYAQQVGRDAVLVDPLGQPYSTPLSAIQRIRFEGFKARLADAWREYDEKAGQ